jgi:hypothetical protein
LGHIAARVDKVLGKGRARSVELELGRVNDLLIRL